MPKVLVLYYSSYGHIEKMAEAVAEGARSAGARVDIKRVPETVPEAIAKSAHFKLNQPAPVATVAELENYDAIVVGTGTRFGRMSSQMAAFLDQAGGLWAKGALHGKIGAAFASSATQHGGQEMTLFSIITNLLHFGMTIVGLPYSHQGQMSIEEIVGGCSLRCHYGCRRRWIAPADRDRLGRCTPSRRIGRKDGSQAFRLINNNQCRLREAPASRTRTTSVAMRPESKRRPSC